MSSCLLYEADPALCPLLYRKGPCILHMPPWCQPTVSYHKQPSTPPQIPSASICRVTLLPFLDPARPAPPSGFPHLLFSLPGEIFFSSNSHVTNLHRVSKSFSSGPFISLRTSLVILPAIATPFAPILPCTLHCYPLFLIYFFPLYHLPQFDHHISRVLILCTVWFSLVRL